MHVEQPGMNQILEVSADVRIRTATEADIPTIRSIAEAAWPVAFGEIVSVEFLRHELNREYSDAALIEQMQAQKHCFLMAEPVHGQDAVGFVSYSVREEADMKVATVHKLYLLPNLKGKGYGAALLDAAIECVEAVGCVRVELSVNRQNPAVRFYEKRGFSILHERDIEVGPGFVRNDYLMSKPLSGC